MLKSNIILARKPKPTLLLTKITPTVSKVPFPNPANELKVRGLAGTPQSRALNTA